MKEYRVHFSFYAEDYGRFESMHYNVRAETPYDAREEAWRMNDGSPGRPLMSCVKQTGVTWDSSPLDVQDYFNAKMAACQQSRREIENVTMPNTEIDNDTHAKMSAERSRSFEYGMAFAIQQIAMEQGKPFNIVPPNVFEEIVYGEKLLEHMYARLPHDEALINGLYQLLEKARHDEFSGVFPLRELFTDGFLSVGTEYYNLRKHFNKDGICPFYADIDDNERQYVNRWTNVLPVNTLSNLRPFDERNVIKNSAAVMLYDYETLVLKKDILAPESQKAMYLLWAIVEPDACLEGFGTDPDKQLVCENKITGHHAVFRRADFHGVLRPEFEQRIDYDKLKAEYEALPEQVKDADVIYISPEPTREAAYGDESDYIEEAENNFDGEADCEDEAEM